MILELYSYNNSKYSMRKRDTYNFSWSVVFRADFDTDNAGVLLLSYLLSTRSLPTFFPIIFELETTFVLQF